MLGFSWPMVDSVWMIALAPLIIVAFAFAMVLLWIGSRSKFIFLDGVVHDRAELVEPWHRFRGVGDSLFLGRFGFWLACLVAAGLVASPVTPYTCAFTGDFESFRGRWIVGIVLLLVTLLLVPPCANVAILNYARTVARQEEFAARAALGASRRRIVVQLFLEVLVAERYLNAQLGLDDETPGAADFASLQAELVRRLEAAFETFDVPILIGRQLDAGDATADSRSVVVDQTFARLLLGDGNPLGHRVRRLAAGVPHGARRSNRRRTAARGHLCARSAIPAGRDGHDGRDLPAESGRK